MDELIEKLVKIREAVEMLETRGKPRDLLAAEALKAKMDGALDVVADLALGPEVVE